MKVSIEPPKLYTAKQLSLTYDNLVRFEPDEKAGEDMAQFMQGDLDIRPADSNEKEKQDASKRDQV